MEIKLKMPAGLECDKCHRPISRIEDGWIEWWECHAEGKPGMGLRLVHHADSGPGGRDCQHGTSMINLNGIDYSLSDVALRDFLGVEGLDFLLWMIENDKVPAADVVAMIRRLHIPRKA